MKRLSDDLQSSKAEATLERLGRKRAIEALRHEKKKRERGKKLMEQFRAEEGSGAILFSPNKVRGALELQRKREQEQMQEKADKETRAQERATAKIQKQQEIQRRRNERVMARDARKAAEALKRAQKTAEKKASEAQKQAKTRAKAFSKDQRRAAKKEKAHPKLDFNKNTSKAQEVPKQPRSRSGRTIRTPAWLLN